MEKSAYEQFRHKMKSMTREDLLRQIYIMKFRNDELEKKVTILQLYKGQPS